MPSFAACPSIRPVSRRTPGRRRMRHATERRPSWVRPRSRSIEGDDSRLRGRGRRREAPTQTAWHRRQAPRGRAALHEAHDCDGAGRRSVAAVAAARAAPPAIRCAGRRATPVPRPGRATEAPASHPRSHECTRTSRSSSRSTTGSPSSPLGAVLRRGASMCDRALECWVTSLGSRLIGSESAPTNALRHRASSIRLDAAHSGSACVARRAIGP